jgi:hypothetical protein
MIEQTVCPSDFPGPSMAQYQVYSMFAEDDRRAMSRFGRKQTYELKTTHLLNLIGGERRIQNRTGCSIRIELSGA